MDKPISCVYVIKCPYTQSVLYVGQTANFKVRKIAHLTCTKTYSPIGLYMSYMRSIYVTPIIEVYKVTRSSALFNQEQIAMRYFRKLGVPLLNKNGFRSKLHEAIEKYIPNYSQIDKRNKYLKEVQP